jgi:hypothetical protein
MSITEFLGHIESPRLLNVARHWLVARGGRRMPGWRDIDPLAIAAELPIVWSWKYDRLADSFTGRLAGDDVDAVFGKSMRGVPMKDFFDARFYELVFARHRRVVTEPALAHGSGPVFVHADRYGQGERIILPLADDGEHGDGLIGATVYPLPSDGESGAELAVAETVLMFSLD